MVKSGTKRSGTKLRREGRGNSSYVRIPGALTSKQLAAARSFFASDAVQGMMDEGDLFDHGANTSRSSRVAWIERHDEEGGPSIPPWLHAKLRAAAKSAHSVYGDRVAKVGVDKNGTWKPRFEPLQYAEYAEGGHYRGWHTDAEEPEVDPEDARCLTVVLLLSDRSAYSGGHFEAKLNGKGGYGTGSKVPIEAGDAIVFLSKHLWHRVSKCKSGLRQSLVFWVRRRGAARLPRFLPASMRDEEAASPS